MEKEQSEKKYPETEDQPVSLIMMVILTGLWGGIFWSVMGFIGHFFHFTKISPRIVLEPWAVGGWKNGWIGMLIAIILLGIISIGAAFLYYALLKKIEGMWAGIGYGIVLFLLVFLALNPMFPEMAPLTKLDKNTLVTSVCLFVLYGVFVGYSISWEYQNQIKARQHATE